MSHHPNPRTRLTPAMRGLIDRIARAGHPPFHSLTPAQARQAYELSGGVLDIPPHALARVQTLQIPTRDGATLNACLFAPSAAAGLPVLLYFHGGGFTIGSVATHAPLCRTLAHQGRCAVLSVDYRLAPDAKFPTAVHDAWDSLQWLRAQAGELGLDAARIAVGGDSAGGTLATVSAIAARDAGQALSLQLLFYPGCAGHQDTPSHKTYAHGFVLDEPQITSFFTHYLRDARDRDDWRFAPLDGRDESGQTKDLDGVAPAWIGLAECDPLFDEGMAYADRLRLAGVAVDLDIYAGVAHGFIQFGRAIPEALTAHQDAARALRHAFGTPDPTPTMSQKHQRKDFRFFHRLRVRWAEVDMQKIVFNAHYLMYFDTAISDYWRAMALPYEEAMVRLDGDLYVVKATVEFHASARMDDQIEVAMKCARIGNSSLTFHGAIFRGDEHLISGELVYVFADPVTQTSRPVPERLRALLHGFEAGGDVLDLQVGRWDTLGTAARELRTAVFVQEQRIPLEIELDEADATAVHAVAHNRLGQVVGTGRLLQPEPGIGKIGRMAVHRALRGGSVGRRVLLALMDEARERGDRELVLHAQRSAVGFYLRLGFVARGEPFTEAGIEHLEMFKPL